MPSRTLVLWPTAVVLLVTRPSVHWAGDCSGHPASAVCAAAPLTLIPLPTPTHWLPLGGHRRSVPRERAARTRTRWRRRCRTTSRTTPSRSVGFGAPAPPAARCEPAGPDVGSVRPGCARATALRSRGTHARAHTHTVSKSYCPFCKNTKALLDSVPALASVMLSRAIVCPLPAAPNGLHCS